MIRSDAVVAMNMDIPFVPQAGSDAVVAWMTKTGSMTVTDRFLFAKLPIAVPVDETSNVEVTSFAQDDDVLTFAFTRDIVTGVSVASKWIC